MSSIYCWLSGCTEDFSELILLNFSTEELDCNWRLQRMGEEGVPTYTEWLKGDADLDTAAGNTFYQIVVTR